ncbi:MAG: heme-binding domain-containing protein [Vicingaceae bacterium]
MKVKIALGLILVFAVMQLFTIERVLYEKPTEQDFILIEKPNQNVELLLKNVCYDCHSNQVKYPWYSGVAPFSWIVNDHIEEGREHFNLSTWGNYDSGKKEHKAEEAWEEVAEGEMPLKSYTFIHREANLDHDQVELLVSYFKEIQQQYK